MLTFLLQKDHSDDKTYRHDSDRNSLDSNWRNKRMVVCD